MNTSNKFSEYIEMVVVCGFFFVCCKIGSHFIHTTLPSPKEDSVVEVIGQYDDTMTKTSGAFLVNDVGTLRRVYVGFDSFDGMTVSDFLKQNAPKQLTKSWVGGHAKYTPILTKLKPISTRDGSDNYTYSYSYSPVDAEYVAYDSGYGSYYDTPYSANYHKSWAPFQYGIDPSKANR